MLPGFYRAATSALAPFALLYLLHRRRRGKEDAVRFRERLGRAGRERPDAPLVWMHAASVGEATSVLALIERLRAQRPGVEILITTGTVASAQLLDRRLPQGARHQFVPVDLRGCVERFLDHWRPDLALWVESELWPNLVLATHRRGIPMALVNGRLSARSYERWQLLPGLIRPMLGAFSLCLAQDAQQAERFRRLGAETATSVGDLKAAAAMLPVDPAALTALRRQIGARPVWVAASTHPGEEEAVADAHGLMQARIGNLLTIVAPRHERRSGEVATLLRAHGLTVARRSRSEPITPDTQVYLADTMGELGLFYRLAGIAFIGGSLAPNGGHNPFEAARLDCAVLHGPDMSNCATMAAALREAGAAEPVANAAELAAAVARLLADPNLRAERAAAGARAALGGFATLDRVLQLLASWLDAIGPATGTDVAALDAAARPARRADARP
ncbi:MAG TPA: 3-deoxy-D-manno-octulosonic acid transferase [Stellaceae bacterium]|nr:3-deoxy-D-manno-octulosonic acid transferase [Stellaceae bacterium]